MPSDKLQALLQLQALQDLPRTGWIQRGVPDAERVAGHILGAQFIALALAGEVQPPLDLGRVLALILVHDAPEALLGDLPRSAAELLPAGAKAQAEARAAQRLLGPLAEDGVELFTEYTQGATREARFARVCDRLQLALRWKGYQRLGLMGLDDFEAGLRQLDTREFQPAQQLLEELLSP